MNPVDKFLIGFLSPLQGLKLIFSSKKKFVLSIFPFVMGIAVIISVLGWAFQYLGGAVEDRLQQFEVLSGFLMTAVVFVVTLFSWMAVALSAFIVSYIVISLFGGPFYSMLSEDVFMTESAQGLKKSRLSLMIKMFFLSLLKVLILLFVGLICFLVSFIPVLNLVSTFVVFLIIAFDCTDYAFEVDGLGLRGRFAQFFKRFWEFSGLATAIMCTSLLPGSFFVLLPAFICGATKMYIQVENK